MRSFTFVAGGLAAATTVLMPNPAGQVAAPVAPATVAATPHVGVTQAAPSRDPVIRIARPHVAPGSAKPARPKPAKRAAAKPTAVHHAAGHKASPQHYPSGPTSWGALNAAIARIPTYHTGQAHWVVQDTGWWGTADWNTSVIYISRSVPESKLYDVAVHEWSHILTTLDYGGDPTLAIAATAAFYGGVGLNGAEDAADCMAILQGAQWTHYTSCSSSRWRSGAQALIDGHRLPGISIR